PIIGRNVVLLAQAQPQQPILTTNRRNPSHSESPDWSKDICGGKTVLDLGGPDYEWTQVVNRNSEFDDYVVGISGVGVWPHISGEDLPFTHPFGNDWEFFIAPDQQYTSLLAKNNLVTNPSGDKDYFTARDRAERLLRLSVPQGVLGVETDQDLVPPPYRFGEG